MASRRPQTAAVVPRRPLSSRRLYVFLVMLFVVLSALEFGLGQLPLTEAQVELGDYERSQLELFRERTQLLTTLATAVIGATAGLLLQREGKLRLEKAESRRVITSIVFASASIYFGHLAGSQVLFMLHSKFFNLYYAGIWLPSQLQFVSFLCSIIFLADTTYRMVLRAQREG